MERRQSQRNHMKMTSRVSAVVGALLLVTLSSASAFVAPRTNASRNRVQLHMGLGTTLKRVKDSVLSKERSREDLKIGIAGFYDRSSKLWEDVWGEVRAPIRLYHSRNSLESERMN
jgi:hypothetical protein